MVELDKVTKIVKKFKADNGHREIPLSDLVIYFNTEQLNRSERIEKKLDSHIKWSQKAIVEHDKIIQHIVDELPEKGWCEKIQNIMDCWQPYKKEPPLNIKVQTLWYDRKVLKFLTGALVVAIFASVGSIIINLVM